MNQTKTGPRSQFNEADQQIKRLGDLWNEANFYSKKGMFDEWQFVLDNIWRELTPDIKQTKLTEYQIKILKINTEILKSKREKNKARLYMKLGEKEVILRNLQEDVGKGSKRDTDSERRM